MQHDGDFAAAQQSVAVAATNLLTPAFVTALSKLDNRHGMAKVQGVVM
jgi:hypothetical protein